MQRKILSTDAYSYHTWSYKLRRFEINEWHSIWNIQTQACAALSLLDDDNEKDNVLSKASVWAIGNQLRNMFNKILIFCEVTDPNELWNKHWSSLSHDLEAKN